MIYRETIWKDGDVAVVEVIPLASENIPIDFSRFRFRMAMQGMDESGPIRVSCDVPLAAYNVVEAIDIARGMKASKEAELTKELTKKIESVWREKINATTNMKDVDLPKIEEEQGPSER